MSPRLALGLVLSLIVGPLAAQDASVFNRVSTFEVASNLPAGRTGRTIAEIVAATEDGNTLAYVDGQQRAIGFVDITDAARPRAAGFVPTDGEPNSVAIRGTRAFAVVSSSASFTAPAGHVAVIDIASRTIVERCELGGQPDSVTVSRDGRFLVVVIENERDERLDNGRLPQMPPGNLTVVPLTERGLDCPSLRRVDLTGLAQIAPEDPEPEFVDVNGRGEAVVTLQENNHIVIVDVASGRVIRHFSAGAVTLERIDATTDGVIRPTDRRENVRREPDAVRWLDDDRFVTANEGDYQGGSRGFTIFRADGTVEWDSSNVLEHLAIRLGHFPERRARNRGNEPEGVEVATFGGQRYIFIGSERASLVTVWRDRGSGQPPEYVQALPSGVAPEGLLALPTRGLFIAANEVDNPENGLRSNLAVFRFGPGPARYPTLQSDVVNGLPIPWGALSGLSADRTVPGRLYAVTDSFYAEARILTIDATAMPARIVGATVVTENGEAARNLDLEGIAVRAQGGFWLVSEGNPERQGGALPNRLLRVSTAGVVEERIELPEALARGATRFGFEGVTVTGSGETETVWIAVQREWEGDPRGRTRILSYRVATRQWGVLHYPLSATPRGWMGLSEITAVSDTEFVVIERNNLYGTDAIKRLMRFSIAGLTPAAPGAPAVPVVEPRLVIDVVPLLAATGGIVLEKLEGFTIDAAGNAFAVTDNDGVDGSTGETQFLSLGRFLQGR
jgi:hypothetical protein